MGMVGKGYAVRNAAMRLPSPRDTGRIIDNTDATKEQRQSPTKPFKRKPIMAATG